MNRLQRPLAVPLAELMDSGSDWGSLLRAWRDSPAGRALMTAVDARVATGRTVFPSDVFRALRLTPMAEVRVVVLGQDPYHGTGQAEGLAFSVPVGQVCPPSLRNIFKELQRDLGLLPPPRRAAGLQRWAAQGVLLLNSALTVEEGRAASHARLGWSSLTGMLMQALLDDRRPKVFMLWGANAQAAVEMSMDQGPHRVLRCNHPSPLSARRPPAPFLGCGHFGEASRFLSASGQGAVDWALP